MHVTKKLTYNSVQAFSIIQTPPETFPLIAPQ